MPSVTVFFSGHEQSTYPLDKPTVIVGREEGCQIHIDNRSISRQHCAFYAKGNGFLIQDLNSANGTYVNGHKITEHCLSPGDMVIIGKYELRYNEGQTLAHAKAPPKNESAKHVPNIEEPTESYQLWFYAVDGEQKGPVDVAALRRLARDHAIAPDTLVWHAGMPDWIPVSTAPGILSPEDPPPVQQGMFQSSSESVAAAVSAPPAEAPKAAPIIATPPVLTAHAKPEPPKTPQPEAPVAAPAAPAAVEASAGKLAYTEAERQTCENLAKFLRILGWLMLASAALGILSFLRSPVFHLPSALQIAAIVASGVLALSASVAFDRIKNSDGDDRENTFIALRQVLKLCTTQIVVIALMFVVYVLAIAGIL